MATAQMHDLMMLRVNFRGLTGPGVWLGRCSG